MPEGPPTGWTPLPVVHHQMPDGSTALAELDPTGGVRILDATESRIAQDDWARFAERHGPKSRRAPAQPEPPAGMKTALYRDYDVDELLLYIGVADVPARRRADHRRASSWAAFSVRSEIEWFASREDAELAEIAAIQAESPLFNDQHNRTDAARMRLVNYLIDKGRLDLLAPAVSRG